MTFSASPALKVFIPLCVICAAIAIANAEPNRARAKSRAGTVNAPGLKFDVVSIKTERISDRRQELWNRIVLDRTGLTGTYDFTLPWTPEAGTRLAPGPPPPDTPGISIFSALREQLGLRLEAAKAPVGVVVINHIDKPEAN
jgi:uncharacterized protein (TIGR03435 family)